MSTNWLKNFSHTVKELDLLPQELFDAVWPSDKAIVWDEFNKRLEAFHGPYGKTLWKIYLARKHDKQKTDTQEPTRG